MCTHAKFYLSVYVVVLTIRNRYEKKKMSKFTFRFEEITRLRREKYLRFWHSAYVIFSFYLLRKNKQC